MFMNIRKTELREGTTRYVEVSCADQSGSAFDFTDCTATTWLSFLGGMFVPTAISGSTISYKIPAEASVGENNGVAETRIFKTVGTSVYDVFEALRVDINVISAYQPIVTPSGATPEPESES